jgi:hypothetical protein
MYVRFVFQFQGQLNFGVEVIPASGHGCLNQGFFTD